MVIPKEAMIVTCVWLVYIKGMVGSAVVVTFNMLPIMSVVKDSMMIHMRELAGFF